MPTHLVLGIKLPTFQRVFLVQALPFTTLNSVPAEHAPERMSGQVPCERKASREPDFDPVMGVGIADRSLGAEFVSDSQHAQPFLSLWYKASRTILLPKR